MALFTPVVVEHTTVNGHLTTVTFFVSHLEVPTILEILDNNFTTEYIHYTRLLDAVYSQM